MTIIQCLSKSIHYTEAITQCLLHSDHCTVAITQWLSNDSPHMVSITQWPSNSIHHTVGYHTLTITLWSSHWVITLWSSHCSLLKVFSFSCCLFCARALLLSSTPATRLFCFVFVFLLFLFFYFFIFIFWLKLGKEGRLPGVDVCVTALNYH